MEFWNVIHRASRLARELLLTGQGLASNQPFASLVRAHYRLSCWRPVTIGSRESRDRPRNYAPVRKTDDPSLPLFPCLPTTLDNSSLSLFLFLSFSLPFSRNNFGTESTNATHLRPVSQPIAIKWPHTRLDATRWSIPLENDRATCSLADALVQPSRRAPVTASGITLLSRIPPRRDSLVANVCSYL